MELLSFFICSTLSPARKNFFLESIHDALHKSCWKSIHQVSWLQTNLGTTVLENIVIRSGRNTATIRFPLTISDLQLKQITIQEDHNIHTYSLYCLVVLAVENSRKPFLLVTSRHQIFFIFSFLTKKQKKEKKKKEKFCTLFFNMT